MANIDFESMTPEQEESLLEDYEEIATFLLESMGFEPGQSDDGVTFKAVFSLQDPEEYIQKKLEEDKSSNP
jgi:hypothetical protein